MASTEELNWNCTLRIILKENRRLVDQITNDPVETNGKSGPYVSQEKHARFRLWEKGQSVPNPAGMARQEKGKLDAALSYTTSIYKKCQNELAS